MNFKGKQNMFFFYGIFLQTVKAGVIILPICGGIKPHNLMFRDFPHYNALLGLVRMTPVRVKFDMFKAGETSSVQDF